MIRFSWKSLDHEAWSTLIDSNLRPIYIEDKLVPSYPQLF